MTDIWKVQQEDCLLLQLEALWVCRCHPALLRIKKKGQQSFSLHLQLNQPSSQFIYFLSLATVLVCAPPWVSSGLCCHWPQRVPGEQERQKKQNQLCIISPNCFLQLCGQLEIKPVSSSFFIFFFSLFTYVLCFFLFFFLPFHIFQPSQRGGKAHQGRDGDWKSPCAGQASEQRGKEKKLNASEIYW